MPQRRPDLAISPKERDPDGLRGIQDFAEDGLHGIQDFAEDGLRGIQDFAEDWTLLCVGKESCSVVFSLGTQTFMMNP